MIINLEEFVNKEVVIVFQDGSRKETVIGRDKSKGEYPYFIKGKYGDTHYYSQSGYNWNPSFCDYRGNIVDIVLKKSQKTMALSDKTIKNIASTLVPEAVKYVYESEEYVQFLTEQFTKFMNKKIGPMNHEVAIEIISIMVSEAICDSVSEPAQEH
jgi:hypothetical protein